MRLMIPALLATAVAASPAMAGPQSAGTRITATVPAVCKVETGSFAAAEDGSVRGEVHELCNGGPGFRIVASHRPLGAGESATVHYGLRAVALQSSGESVIASHSGLRAARVPVRVETNNLDAPLALAFSVTTL